MRKNIAIIALTVLTLVSLTGCNRANEDSSHQETSTYDPLDEDEIYLQKDMAKDYVYAPSSNENGSMNYEIFVRSFYDSDGDGIGDLNGVKAKLPYLADMGYKTLWLMPIHPSGSYHGYDVINYYEVNADYGTLEDFDSLVSEAKKYNIDIMLDMVLNHCSIQNSYFQEAFADYKAGKSGEDSKADWFNFGSTGDHAYQGVYYESKFDASMPDFNLDSEGVRAEIENIVKFWIERGVKGFRLDAVLYYYYQNTNQNIAFLNWLADTCHKYDDSFYIVGECWASSALLSSYFASKCDSFFDFSLPGGGDNVCISYLKGYGRIKNVSQNIEKNESLRKEKNPDAYSSYFLSNHDMDRIAKNFTEEDIYKAACSFYTLLPGAAYTYYGEEIALKGTRNTNPDDQNDVKRRLPMIWSKADKAGECSFPDKTRPDLDTTVQVEEGVEEQQSKPFSLTNHYKMMIHIRNKYSWIKHASYKDLSSALQTSEYSVMAYSLSYEEEKIIVVHNFSSHNVAVTSPGTEILEQINTAHRIPELSEGKLRLAAHSSVILK